MRRLYLVLACLVILLGLVHFAATFGTFDAFTDRAVWFASGGLAILLTGILNVLNRAYGAAAPGLRWATFGANAVMTLFAALAGIAGGASDAQLVVIVGLLAATTLVSFRPSPVSG
jgi:hypothetical protein